MTPEDQTLHSADVHGSARSWGVEARGWKHLRPDLADDVIALLAPSIVVTARRYDAATGQVAASITTAAGPATTTANATAISTATAPRTMWPAPPVRRPARRRTRG